MLSSIGKTIWGMAGWSMPSLGLIPYFVAAGTVVLSITATVAYHKGAEGRAAAVATEKAGCEVRIAESARASAESLSHVLGTIKAGEEAAVEPKNAAEEAAACKKSKLCRGAK